MHELFWKRFTEYGTRIEVSRDTVLNGKYDNHMSNCVFLLEEGICALTSITKQGEEKVYLYFHPKRLINFNQFVISEEKLQIKGPEFIIISKTPCTLIRISTTVFQDLIAKDPEFNACLIQTLADNYSDALNHFHLMQEESAVIRLCHLLIEISHVKKGVRVVPKYFTYAELAKYLGCHPVTVSRIMAKLKQGGYISKSPDGIIIEQEEGLQELINSESLFKY